MKSEKTKTDEQILREWISKQPHLPQNIHEMLLKRFLHSSNNSIEITKNLIDLFFTLRNQLPEIFDNRDPAQPEIQETFENVDFVPLSQLTENNYKVYVYRLLTSDLEKYDFINGLKSFFIFADIRMIVDEHIADGEIPIFDLKNYTMRHLTKVVLPVLRRYMLYSQEAHPIRLKQIHLLNVPPFIDRCMALVKPFMKSEVGKMVHLHHPNSDTLYQYIPKEILPEEYGGNAGKCAEIKRKWCEKIMDHRDYLTDDSRWKLDESKRPVENVYKKQLVDMQGSFRSLNID